MKKESKLAREAIRWLENQFKQGNRLHDQFLYILLIFFLNSSFKIDMKNLRFLRAQNQNEKLTKTIDRSLKKKDVDLWCFQQLVDCCAYFQQHQQTLNGGESKKSSNMVTLLYDGSSEKYSDSNKYTNASNLINEHGNTFTTLFYPKL